MRRRSQQDKPQNGYRVEYQGRLWEKISLIAAVIPQAEDGDTGNGKEQHNPCVEPLIAP